MQHNIIYKVVNTITDEVYIGATTKSIEDRKMILMINENENKITLNSYLNIDTTYVFIAVHEISKYEFETILLKRFPFESFILLL